MQTGLTFTCCLMKGNGRSNAASSIKWVQALARWMPGTGQVLHNSGRQDNGGDDALNNRHSSWLRPRK